MLYKKILNLLSFQSCISVGENIYYLLCKKLGYNDLFSAGDDNGTYLVGVYREKLASNTLRKAILNVSDRYVWIYRFWACYNSPLYFLFLSSTISRVLYQTIIFLDCTLPHSSSARFPGQNATNPEARRAAVSLPIRSCFGWSLHSLVCYQPSGGLLPRHSTITGQPKVAGCFFSIALVLESPPPDVIRHPALWSPDFPHQATKVTFNGATVCAAPWYSITLFSFCKFLFRTLHTPVVTVLLFTEHSDTCCRRSQADTEIELSKNHIFRQSHQQNCHITL